MTIELIYKGKYWEPIEAEIPERMELTEPTEKMKHAMKVAATVLWIRVERDIMRKAFGG